jgi:hypothetical protein
MCYEDLVVYRNMASEDVLATVALNQMLNQSLIGIAVDNGGSSGEEIITETVIAPTESTAPPATDSAAKIPL